MDDKDKNFEEKLANNLDKQKKEMAAGTGIEAVEGQQEDSAEMATAAGNAEREAELTAGQKIEETIEERESKIANSGAIDKWGNNGMAGNRGDNGSPDGDLTNKGGDSNSAVAGFDEEAAKRLLAEETRKTHEKLQQIEKKNRKLLVVVLVMAVILCLAGTAFALFMSNRSNDDNEPVKDESAKVEEDKTDPQPEVPEDTVTELAVDDGLVQRLYNYVSFSGDGWYGTARIYTDPKIMAGDVSKDMMMLMAIKQLPKASSCKGWDDYMVTMDDGSTWNYAQNGCYDGAAVVQKVKEIFGKDLKLEDGDVAGGEACGRWKYSMKNGEFYSDTLGCGGSCIPYVMKDLYKAEKDGDNIYLYEIAVANKCPEEDGGTTYFHVAETNNEGIFVGAPINEATSLDGYNEGKIDIIANRELFDEFKWTFTKYGEGDYVFAGLERVK